MKASDNTFPKLKLAEGVAPSAPPAGQVVIYAKNDGNVYAKDDAGTERALGDGTVSSFAAVATVTTATHNLVAADLGKYNRTTYAGAAAVTVQTNAAAAIAVDAEVHFRAVGGALTLTPASGVTLNAPAGGTLVVPQRGTVTLKKVATNEWDVIGVTEAAP